MTMAFGRQERATLTRAENVARKNVGTGQAVVGRKKDKVYSQVGCRTLDQPGYFH